MGDPLGVIFHSVAATLRGLVDNSPERAFHLVSAMVLVTIAVSLRRAVD